MRPGCLLFVTLKIHKFRFLVSRVFMVLYGIDYHFLGLCQDKMGIFS